jgi:hypothetical protein
MAQLQDVEADIAVDEVNEAAVVDVDVVAPRARQPATGASCSTSRSSGSGGSMNSAREHRALWGAKAREVRCGVGLNNLRPVNGAPTHGAQSSRFAPERPSDHLSRRDKRGGQDDAQPGDRGTHGCSRDSRGLGSLRAPITRTTDVVFGEAGAMHEYGRAQPWTDRQRLL